MILIRKIESNSRFKLMTSIRHDGCHYQFDFHLIDAFCSYNDYTCFISVFTMDGNRERLTFSSILIRLLSYMVRMVGILLLFFGGYKPPAVVLYIQPLYMEEGFSQPREDVHLE